jgi:DNA-binding NtrC family response regulator
LLFTEVSLAGDMNGLDLAQAARERFPALKVLVTSGSANEPMLREKIEQREFAWLPKPFSRRELGECLAEILQE